MLQKKDKKYIGTYFGFFALFYGWFAAVWPFFSNYLLYKGFTPGEIGVFYSISTGFSILGSYFAGHITDKLKSFTSVILLLMGLAYVNLFFAFSVESSLMIMVGFLIGAFFSFSIESVIDTWALEIRPDLSKYYGLMRSGGSLGFSIIIIATGILITKVSMDFMFYGFAIVAGLFWLAILVTKVRGSVGDFHTHQTHDEKLNPLVLFKINEYVFLFVLIVLIQIPVRMMEMFIPLILAEVGGTPIHQGLLYGIGALFEIPFFFWSPRLLSKYRPKRIIAIASLLALGKGLFVVLSKSPEMIVVGGLFAPGYFALFFSALRYRISRIAPNHLKTTAQSGITIAFSGISGVIAGSLGGYLIETIGINKTMNIALVLLILVVLGTMYYGFIYKRKQV